MNKHIDILCELCHNKIPIEDNKKTHNSTLNFKREINKLSKNIYHNESINFDDICYKCANKIIDLIYQLKK